MTWTMFEYYLQEIVDAIIHMVIHIIVRPQIGQLVKRN